MSNGYPPPQPMPGQAYPPRPMGENQPSSQANTYPPPYPGSGGPAHANAQYPPRPMPSDPQALRSSTSGYPPPLPCDGSSHPNMQMPSDLAPQHSTSANYPPAFNASGMQYSAYPQSNEQQSFNAMPSGYPPVGGTHSPVPVPSGYPAAPSASDTSRSLGPVPSGYPPIGGTHSLGPVPSGYPPVGGTHPPGPVPSGYPPVRPMANQQQSWQNSAGGYPPAGPVPSGYPGQAANQGPFTPQANYGAQPNVQQHGAMQQQIGYAPQPIGGLSAGYAQGRPTVMPASPFDPVSDAKTLRKAMKGFGTNERALIDVLAYRTNQQRQQIITAFNQTHHRVLIDDIKSETSGNFLRVLEHLLLTPAQYDAHSLARAVQGIGTNETVLNEILATRSSSELAAIKDTYLRKYRRNLDADVKSDTSGDYKQICQALLANQRDDGPANPNLAVTDAKELYKAGEGRMGTTESVFAAILSTRSRAHIRLVAQEYGRVSRKDLLSAIRSEFSGSTLNMYVALVEFSIDPPLFFAKAMRGAMQGSGTDDSTLSRLIITRSERDLEDIKARYRQMYKTPLGAAVSSETSGDYRKILLALLREAY